MLFNSLGFCAFFVVVTTLYYALPWSARWKMLLVASCYFYMSFVPVYILILLVTILIDYFMGILIADAEGPRRKLYLVISIVSTCAVLFVFKYYNFFAHTSQDVAHIFGFTPNTRSAASSFPSACHSTPSFAGRPWPSLSSSRRS
jgi:D-alanyl-lipoteichoic acid acyltransferase DltB (MBOAT superfamily)